MVRIVVFGTAAVLATYAFSKLDRVFDWMAERKEKKMELLQKEREAAELRRQLLKELRSKSASI